MMNGNRESQPWAALPESELLLEPFDHEVLVFNRLSGQTHFLNATAADLLKLLQERPRTLQEMHTGIADSFDTEEEPVLIQSISRVLQEFEHAGLICPSQA